MNKNFIEDGDFPLPFSMESNVRVRNVPSKQYTIFIDKLISEPSAYRDAVEALESAAPWDEVRVIIVSGGGQLNTGLTLIDYIKGCEAPVTAYIHDECASMATGIALACDNWVIGEFAHFMIHSASFFQGGKAHEVASQHDFMQKYLDRFLKKMYTGFLTAKEIAEVANGRDMWIDTDELKQRLSQYASHRRIQDEKERKRKEKERKQLEKLYAQTAD